MATNDFQKHIADANEFSSVVLIRNIPDVLITTPFFDRVLTNRRALVESKIRDSSFGTRLFVPLVQIRSKYSTTILRLCVEFFTRHQRQFFPYSVSGSGVFRVSVCQGTFAQRDGGVQQSDPERVVGNVVSSIDGALWSLRRALHWKLRFEKRGRVA